MAKLDKNYESYVGFLRNTFSWVNRFFYKFVDNKNDITKALPPDEYYTIIHGKKNPISKNLSYILGPMQTFKYMVKDVTNTWKPYKSRYHVRKDVLQPIFGLGNLLKGVFILIAAPISIAVNLFLVIPAQTLWAICKARSPYLGLKIGLNLKRTPAWILDGVFHVIRGITQIATAPLTWLIKMPIRAAIGWKKGKPISIEENTGIQKLVEKGQAVIAVNNTVAAFSMDMIMNALHAKYHKARARGQATIIDDTVEAARFRFPHKDRIRIGNSFGTGKVGKYNILYSNYKNDKIQEQSMTPDQLGHAESYLSLFAHGRIAPAAAAAPAAARPAV